MGLMNSLPWLTFGTMIILSSASQVARVTGVSHQHPARNIYFKHPEHRNVRHSFQALIPVILAVRRLRQGDCEFEHSLGYIARPCLKKARMNKQTNPEHWWLTHTILATRGRDQEGHSWKPAMGNSLPQPISKPITRKELAQMVRVPA
jgi:hypothetical protein